jgi:hypothetical protein
MLTAHRSASAVDILRTDATTGLSGDIGFAECIARHNASNCGLMLSGMSNFGIGPRYSVYADINRFLIGPAPARIRTADRKLSENGNMMSFLFII